MNIYDIARRAGVSIATVSRVLNQSPKVSEKTREKVLAVMREQEFTPNVFARGLGLGTMGMVGVLCTDVADLYYATAVAALESLLRRSGLDAILYCTGNGLADKKKAVELLLAKNVDAVFLVGSAFKEQNDNSHIEQAAKKVPVIVINGLVELPGVYCVLCDERQAMRDNIARIFERGYRRVLYLYDAETYSGTQKLAGYRDGLDGCGLAYDRELVVRVKKDVASVRGEVIRLLERGVEFDAVLASEDIIAVGACKALDSVVPVIGFNNSAFAECATPALTSVDNMVETLCTTAVGMLREILGGGRPPSKIVVAARLIERETFKTT